MDTQPHRIACLALLVLSAAAPVRADEVTTKYQVTGLFCKERVADLRDVVANVPGVKLGRVDYDNATAEFTYDAKKTFPGAKPEDVVKRLDDKLRSESHHTFGARPLSKMAKDKLKLVSIKVAGCDCKACSLAAYEAVYKLDGVERATASFREGRVTALIDPAKTDRDKLKAALKKRGVTVKE